MTKNVDLEVTRNKANFEKFKVSKQTLGSITKHEERYGNSSKNRSKSTNFLSNNYSDFTASIINLYNKSSCTPQTVIQELLRTQSTNVYHKVGVPTYIHKHFTIKVISTGGGSNHRVKR